MRAVAICAALIAWVLEAVPASAQSLGNQTPEVMPWTLRTAESLYGDQPDTGSASEYQWITYQSFTVQASRYLWLHLGFRAAETQIAGLSQPYREDGSLKLAAVGEVLPDLLYLMAAGNYALGHTVLALSDSLPLSNALNGYSPLPDPAFLAVPSGLLGMLLRLPWFSGHLEVGADFYRPGTMHVFDTVAFSPAAFISLQTLYRFTTDSVEHQARLRFFLFNGEETQDKSTAHQEGPMLDGEYDVEGTGPHHALDAGIGAAWKWSDENRPLRLDVPPQTAPDDDNLQRLWGDLRWRPWQGRTRLWTGLRVEALYEVAGDHAGYTARWECGGERLLGKRHPLEISGYALSAEFAGVAYLGGGVQVALSFRHLGSPPSSP